MDLWVGPACSTDPAGDTPLSSREGQTSGCHLGHQDVLYFHLKDFPDVGLTRVCGVKLEWAFFFFPGCMPRLAQRPWLRKPHFPDPGLGEVGDSSFSLPQGRIG